MLLVSGSVAVAASPKAGASEKPVSHAINSTLRQEGAPITLIESIFTADGKTMVFFHEKGLDLSGLPYNPDSINEAVHDVDTFARKKPEAKIVIAAGGVGLAFDIVLKPVPDNTEHDFVVVGSVNEINKLINNQSPDPTVPALTATKGNNKVSYFAPVPSRYLLPQVDSRVNPDKLDLEIETCNNMVQANYTESSTRTLKSIFTHNPDIIKTFNAVVQEAGCNGYGIAKASRESGLSYKDYLAEVKNRLLTKAAGRGLDVYLPKFLKKQYREMG